MVPDGMTSEVHAFDPREGGSFRISLTYDEPTAAGKTTAHTDTYHGRFVELVPDDRIVEAVEFETDDPAMQGEMTITISLADADGGTDLLAVHDDLPPGLSAADNETGWRMSLGKLAALVEAGRGRADRGDLPMRREPINLEHKLGLIDERWQPKVIAEMNDYQFKLVKIEGDFVWHDHPETDETFLVLEGQLRIDFRDGHVSLGTGEMFVVPKGVEHKPYAEREVKLLLIEPRNVANTGSAGGERTAENDVWI